MKLIELLNEYAPEHLIISCNDAESLLQQITNAGSVFLGNYSPESVVIMLQAPITHYLPMVLQKPTAVFRWIVFLRRSLFSNCQNKDYKI
jgi:histidinol dehydrogenase